MFVSLNEEQARKLFDMIKDGRRDEALDILRPKIAFLDEFNAAPLCEECGGKVGYCDCEEDK